MTTWVCIAFANKHNTLRLKLSNISLVAAPHLTAMQHIAIATIFKAIELTRHRVVDEGKYLFFVDNWGPDLDKEGPRGNSCRWGPSEYTKVFFWCSAEGAPSLCCSTALSLSLVLRDSFFVLCRAAQPECHLKHFYTVSLFFVHYGGGCSTTLYL